MLRPRTRNWSDKIEGLLGVGRIGKVYLNDTRLRRKVAVKIAEGNLADGLARSSCHFHAQSSPYLHAARRAVRITW